MLLCNDPNKVEYFTPQNKFLEGLKTLKTRKSFKNFKFLKALYSQCPFVLKMSPKNSGYSPDIS